MESTIFPSIIFCEFLIILICLKPEFSRIFKCAGRILGITTVRIIQGLKKNLVAKKEFDADFNYNNLNEFYSELIINR